MDDAHSYLDLSLDKYLNRMANCAPGLKDMMHFKSICSIDLYTQLQDNFICIDFDNRLLAMYQHHDGG